MPIGCCSLIPHIATEFALRRPKSVLDLGAGMGIYGAVVRQYLDNGVKPWKTWLVGVEGFAGYENPCWDLYDDVYDGMITCPISDFVRSSIIIFDAVLLLDVIEHFEKPAGLELLAQIRSNLLTESGRLYVGTPAVWMEQGAAHGNEFERHRSLWTVAEFWSLGFEIIANGTRDQWGNQMILASAGRLPVAARAPLNGQPSLQDQKTPAPPALQ